MRDPIGWLAIAVFVLAYALVITEELTGLRKSKPLVLAAGLIWLIVAIAWAHTSTPGVDEALRHNLLAYAELLLFLLAAWQQPANRDVNISLATLFAIFGIPAARPSPKSSILD